VKRTEKVSRYQATAEQNDKGRLPEKKVQTDWNHENFRGEKKDQGKESPLSGQKNKT